MRWSLSRKKKQQKRDSQRAFKRSNLRVESLEDRRLLAGLVNINTTGGVLTVQGDNSVNTVIVSSTGNATEYRVDRPAGDTTQFTLNGAQVSTVPFQVPNILSAINVDLAGGADKFTLDNSAVVGGGLTVVNGNLNIQNDQGGDVNVVTNVRVTGSVNIVDDIPVAPFVPAFAARPGSVPPMAPVVATNSTTTLTDVTINGDLVANQGGGNTLVVTSADTAAISASNPVSSLIQGGIYVQPAFGVVGAGGQNTLTISNNSQVIGPTVVAHNGGGSATTISNSRLQGSFPAGTAIPAIAAASPVAPNQASLVGGVGLVVNNDGAFFAGNAGAFDSVVLQGSTLVGELTTPAAGAAPFSQTAVAINNGPGGSSTSFRADPAATGADANVGPVIRGGLTIANGADIFGTQDVLSMNVTNVFGPTFVYNGAGTSNTTIVNSRLGSSTLVANGAVTGFGNPFALINDAGEDTLVIHGTDIPWGAFINNDDAGLGMTGVWSHRTAITGGVNVTTGAESSIGNLTSDLGTGGANLLAALQKAFPIAFPAPAAAITNQTVQASGPFADAGGGNGTVGTPIVVAPPLVGGVVGQAGDVITFATGANATVSQTIATSTVAGSYTTVAPFGAATAAGDTFSVLGAQTFAFTLGFGVTPPAVGDTVTINNGPGTGQAAVITAVNVTGNVVSMNFAAGAFAVAPNAGNSISITRTSLVPVIPSLPGLLTTGEALFIGGGGGDDTVNIGQDPPAPGTVGGTPVDAPIPFGLQSQLNINLGASGNNSVNIQGSFATPPVAQVIRQLVITGGTNSDNVTIQNVAIRDVARIMLGAGIDSLTLLDATSLPNPLLGGTLVISGGPDAINDVLTADPITILAGGLPLGFTMFP